MHIEIPLEKETVFQRKIGIYNLPMHTHDLLEITVLQKNKGTFRVLEREYAGNPGDVFLFRPFEPHLSLKQDPALLCERIMILFSAAAVRSITEGYKLLLPFYAMDLASPLIPADTVFARQIQTAAELAVQEQELKNPGWKAIQQSLFTHIIVNIYRYYKQTQTIPSAHDKTNGRIIHVIEYILAHFTEEISMPSLIEISELRKTQFYESFSQITGITPNHFIHRLRIQHAIELLCNTKKSITEIAFESGFISLSYFNKIFKQFQNTSPSVYRTLKSHT